MPVTDAPLAEEPDDIDHRLDEGGAVAPLDSGYHLSGQAQKKYADEQRQKRREDESSYIQILCHFMTYIIPKNKKLLYMEYWNGGVLECWNSPGMP